MQPTHIYNNPAGYSISNYTPLGNQDCTEVQRKSNSGSLKPALSHFNLPPIKTHFPTPFPHVLFISPPDKTNKESVRAIEKSICTICLDAPMPRVSDDTYKSSVAAQMLHGGGSHFNSGNRWFDKTIQVSADALKMLMTWSGGAAAS